MDRIGEGPRVLVVDDDPQALRLVDQALRGSGLEATCVADPLAALRALREGPFAAVISDQMMPHMPGTEFLALVRRRWPEVACLMITASDDIRVAAEALNRRLVRFLLPKPFEPAELRRAVLEAVASRPERAPRPAVAAEATRGALALARAVDARDRYTLEHSQRVARYAEAVGRVLGLAADEVEALRLAGLLHDLGKIGVPDAVLGKHGPLTGPERQAMARHPSVGAEIVAPLALAPAVEQAVAEHHEAFDGTGYPHGLVGAAICLAARVVQVVDAYEAMTSDRVYRRALPPEAACQELARCSGAQFDPEVVSALLRVLSGGANP